jgi:hypothetical protein
MWVFPDIKDADARYVYVCWVFPAAVVVFADEEALLEVGGCDDEVDELRKKEDTTLYTEPMYIKGKG